MGSIFKSLQTTSSNSKNNNKKKHKKRIRVYVYEAITYIGLYI